MSQKTLTAPPRPLVYPESDGNPMAENTLQFRWIVTLEGGLATMFLADPDVFVAGDLLWYPVEGNTLLRQAPDAFVVFGRPKGDRRCYKQWEEGNIAPQVVFEVLSPSNRHNMMVRKFQFYERYGVEEYYIYDPDTFELVGYLRDGDRLREIPQMNGWVSPRLKIRFELADGELRVYGPDGRAFASYTDLATQRDQAEKQASQAEKQAAQAEKKVSQAEKKMSQAEKKAAEQAQTADRLRAQLKASGIEPEA